MTKKISIFFIIMSIVTIMLLSGCATGTECELIGIWEKEDNKNLTYEITADDKFIMTTITGNGFATTTNDNSITLVPTYMNTLSRSKFSYIHEFKIKEIKNNEIILKAGHSIKYSDLDYNTVKFDGVKYKKVY